MCHSDHNSSPFIILSLDFLFSKICFPGFCLKDLCFFDIFIAIAAITGITAIREMRNYSLISGEIIKVTGYCLQDQTSLLCMKPRDLAPGLIWASEPDRRICEISRRTLPLLQRPHQCQLLLLPVSHRSHDQIM